MTNAMLHRIQRPILAVLLLPVLLASGCRSTAHAGNPDRLEERGWVQLQLGDAAGALQSFGESLDQERDARVLAGTGQALVALGRSHQARDAFLEAIDLEPEVADWRVGLGLVEASLRDDQAALGAFDEAIEVDANSSKAFYNRARLHAAAGRHEAALEDYSAAIAISNRMAEAYAGRGLVWAALDDRGAAIADFHRAGGLQPCPEAHANCAVVHYADGDVRHALTELNTAIRLELSLIHI